MDKGRTYTLTVDRGEISGTYTGEATLGGVGGYWSFDVQDNSFNKTTHKVYVNPSKVITVIPEWRKS